MGFHRGYSGDWKKMNRRIWNQQHRGQQGREARKRKHNLRAESENKKMRNRESIKFNYEFWGWKIEDPSPFLNIKVYFDKSIIPVNFITSIEKAINERYEQYLQESKISEEAKLRENESDSPDLLSDPQRASLD